MEIIVTSRGMKANDILDMAWDMGLERVTIVRAGEWDGGRIHILTYGPLAYRKMLEIPAPAKKDDVERLLRTAVVSAEAKKLDDPKPVTFEGKQWTAAEVASTEKARKKRNRKETH